jgi:hypothetical protein
MVPSATRHRHGYVEPVSSAVFHTKEQGKGMAGLATAIGSSIKVEEYLGLSEPGKGLLLKSIYPVLIKFLNLTPSFALNPHLWHKPFCWLKMT